MQLIDGKIQHGKRADGEEDHTPSGTWQLSVGVMDGAFLYNMCSKPVVKDDSPMTVSTHIQCKIPPLATRNSCNVIPRAQEEVVRCGG